MSKAYNNVHWDYVKYYDECGQKMFRARRVICNMFIDTEGPSSSSAE